MGLCRREVSLRTAEEGSVSGRHRVQKEWTDVLKFGKHYYVSICFPKTTEPRSEGSKRKVITSNPEQPHRGGGAR